MDLIKDCRQAITGQTSLITCGMCGRRIDLSLPARGHERCMERWKHDRVKENAEIDRQIAALLREKSEGDYELPVRGDVDAIATNITTVRMVRP